MKISVQNIDVTKIKCDVLIVNEFEDVIKSGGATGAVDKALGGIITKLSASKEISGKLGSNVLIHTHGKIAADHVLVAGLGKAKEFGLDEARIASASAVKDAEKIKAKTVATIVHGAGIGGLNPSDACRALVEGTMIGAYKFCGYKTDKKDCEHEISELIIIDLDEKKLKSYKSAVQKASATCEAVNAARDLVNTPSNFLTPSIFADVAADIAKKNKLQYEILGKKDIKKLGMHALWAVAKGSHEEPKVVIIKYQGNPSSKETIGLIGKGINFDSGGISLKPSKNMHEMKTDMAGAAAALCTMQAIAQIGSKKNIIAVIPLTENMPGGGALKPGDVISSFCGKTMEIISTDAEGRMIIVDALCYAKSLGATRLIDIATLTGACVSALGDVASGIMGTEQKFVDELIEAGLKSGERMWQLPLYKEYREYLKSTVADIKNCSDLGKAGTATAGIFLKEYVGETPWVHIDIAGTADMDREYGIYSKGATGAGILTFVNYFSN